MAPYFPGSSRSSTPASPGHGSAKHVFSEKIVIVTDYVLDSAPAQSNFSQSSKRSFFFCPVTFTSSTILLRVSKSSAIPQEELLRTQRRRLSLSSRHSSRRLPLCLLIALATSHVHTRGGAARPQPIANPSAIQIEPEKNQESQFLSSYFGECFDLLGPREGGGGGALPFNLFGDQLSTFLATSCQFFSRQLFF